MVAQHVTVSGRSMDVGEAMTEHVRSQMAALGDRYFGRLIDCRVAFTKQVKGLHYSCTITTQVGQDMHYSATAQSMDVRGCFRQAYDKVAKQLRRDKRMLHEDKPDRRKKAKAMDNLTRPEPPDGGALGALEGAMLAAGMLHEPSRPVDPWAAREQQVSKQWWDLGVRADAMEPRAAPPQPEPAAETVTPDSKKADEMMRAA